MEIFLMVIMVILIVGLMCLLLRCKLYMVSVVMLNLKYREISFVEGGWSGFYVMVVLVVRKMKKKVVISFMKVFV